MVAAENSGVLANTDATQAANEQNQFCYSPHDDSPILVAILAVNRGIIFGAIEWDCDRKIFARDAQRARTGSASG